MTTAYTSLLGLALPVTGELSGTWGDTVNNSITSLLDSAVAGTTTLSTDADVTLTTTTGAANTAREAILLWTAGGTVTRTITAPAQSKIYTVINASSSTQSIKLVGAGPTTGVTILKGESAVCAWNGSDFIKISNTAGAATVSDLTVTSSATLSYGTANGVAYLNGSKVVTTGTALTFDGTGNFFLTAASGGSEIRSYSSAASTTAALSMRNADRYWQMSSQAGGNFLLYDTTGSQSTWLVSPGASGYSAWYQNGSEQMRLTSTGLGIGATSPNYSLTSYKGGAVANYIQVVSGATGAGSGNGLLLGVDASGNSVINAQGAINLYTYVAGVLRTTIDSSGNLGLGVTPSAWGSTNTALQIGNGAIWRSGSRAIDFIANGYYNGTNYIYNVTNAATYYRQIDGAHQWYNAPSGTAGTAITFTQAMTLDASGNLGIGVTSPTAKLDVNGTIYSRTGGIYTDTLTAYSGSSISINAGSSNFNIVVNASERMRIDSAGNVGIGTPTPNKGSWSKAVTLEGSGNEGYELVTNGTYMGVFAAGGSTVAIGSVASVPLTFQTGATERMRLDTVGNLGIGVTPSAWSSRGNLDVISGGSVASQGVGGLNLFSNAYYNGGYKYASATLNGKATQYQASGGGHYWFTDNTGNTTATLGAAVTFTQAMTLDNSGNLLVGATAQPSGVVARFVVSSAISDYSAAILNTNAAPYGLLIRNTTDVNSTGNEFLVCQGAATLRATVRSNGGIANYSANNVNLSDERTKTNIQYAGNYLAKICAIPVRTFKYKDQADDFLNLGVIAQEVETVAPELVDVSGFGKMPEDGIPLKAVYQTDLQYALMKAIQEQQALIESLTKRLAAAGIA